MEDTFRAAFLAASYGTPGERFRLSPLLGPKVPFAFIAGRWAILTAYNPGGRQHAPSLNEAAQRRLEERLSDFSCLPGINGEGEWAEPSVIVSGLPLRSALRLGREFAQVAVLYANGQRAALVWCASGHAERFWVCAHSAGAGPTEEPPVQARETGRKV